MRPRAARDARRRRGGSVAWEYGLEAPHERPSAIDLVWTPVAGAALGEGRYRLHRWLRARGRQTSSFALAR